MPEWLETEWHRLNQTRLQRRMPHALLISGVDGVGKRQLAERMASALLCEHPRGDGDACGQCAACGWLQAGSHPDLLLRMPEEPGKAIKVDQIRELCSELAMTSYAGGYKVAIITPADAMNVNAANSLLKTLEEPTDNTLLMLLTAVPGRLPATIRSRCQKIQLRIPDQAVGLRWLEARGIDADAARNCLQMVRGAPLRALQVALEGGGELRAQRFAELSAVHRGRRDPVQTARDWAAGQEQATLEWWHGWLLDAIRWKMAGKQGPAAPESQELRQIAESVDCRQMFEIADKITSALNSLGSGLNRQLILEDLLTGWADCAQRGQVGNHAGTR